MQAIVKEQTCKSKIYQSRPSIEAMSSKMINKNLLYFLPSEYRCNAGDRRV